MLFLSVLLNAIALGEAYFIYPPRPQVTFQTKQPSPQALRGRFLHISDMHPDPHYISHTSKRNFCHRGKQSVGSGYYGTPYSDCDSPLHLTNFTLDYLDSNWASEIDFVIWTGDNARHDSDESVPRTPAEIKDLNKAVAKKMREIFLERGIPVVPSIGNNDIWPHNLMTLGPNEITKAFSGIWKDFIPQQEQASFLRGAYFSTEVIPDKVAVLSLNTIYFYDSNDAAAGCPYDGPGDPGNLEFDWLEEKLVSYRERGMQVWLAGHVPPTPGNYFPECYVRYVDLALRFQDTILGHLYGHMNVDYFAFLETADLEIISEEESEARQDAFKHEDLYDTLLEDFATLPESPEDINLDDYAVINVSPSVVPHPYAPSFRIFSYNVTGDESQNARVLRWRNHRKHRGRYGDKETECGKKEWRKSWKCHLKGAWYSNPESPSRINQLWTPLGYAQYYVPHLEEADEEHEPEFELEYVTWGGEAGEKIYYGMSDLTVGSWVQLGQRLGQGEKQLRRVFKRHMYVGAGDRGRA
ncbi:Metallo-dependent phosphatase-like protein [Amanita rubescens]|nr:Metallo-dependent phosphatase-like protein [Amanita rubescens]